MASLCCCLSRTYGLFIGVLGIILSIYSFIFSTFLYAFLEKFIFFNFGLTIMMVGSGINIVASFLLLLGLCTENHCLLWPWLINNALLPCLLTIGFVVQWQERGFKSGQIPSGIGTLAFLWTVYGLTYLVYKEIQGSRGGGGYFRSRSSRVVAMQSQSMTVY